MNILAGILFSLILLCASLLIPSLIFVAIGLCARKTSSRFPRLAAREKKDDTTPKLADLTAVNKELAPIKVLLSEGKDEEVCDALLPILQHHVAQKSPLEVQSLIAEMLASTLRGLGKPEHAQLVTDMVHSQTVESSGPAEKESLFVMALKDDRQLTLKTLETLEALQGIQRPFATAFLWRFYVVGLASYLVTVVIFGIILIGSQSRNPGLGPRGDAAGGAVVAGLFVALIAISYRYYVVRTTRYELVSGTLKYHHGGLSRPSPYYELYRLHDVVPRRSLMNRFSGDCELQLSFEKEQHPIVLRGWVKVNEMENLAMALREISRAIRTSPAIKGILT